MRKGILTAVLGGLVAMVAMLSGVGTSNATFHLMRIYEVMGGAAGATNIQYVEMRMAEPGQNLVGGHTICFFDANGAPWARFKFAANVASSIDESSILVGSSEFDTAWAAGSPDATFSGANTVAINPSADVNHPIPVPAGKVEFGTDSAAVPAQMCAAGINLIVDSVAYGTGYTGGVDYGAKFPSNLPTTGAQEIHYLAGFICHPFSFSSMCGSAPDNSVDYGLATANTAGNQPRNNAGNAGPITMPDSDGDGVDDSADLCPGTAPAAPVDTVGCSQVQVDKDADGWCDPGAAGPGPGPCMGADNCPLWANPTQALPNWSVPTGDADCDGYPDTVKVGVHGAETSIGTDPMLHCNATVTRNDEAVDAWPTDMDDNQLTNLQDIGTFNALVGARNGIDPRYTARNDLNADNLINLQDIGQLNPFFGKRCI